MSITHHSDPDIRQQLADIVHDLSVEVAELALVNGVANLPAADRAYDKLLALISQTVSSVIGEDEDGENSWSPKRRNELRAEQRATLKRLLEGGESCKPS